MIGSYTVRYQITPEALADAARLHQSRFLAKYRAVMAMVAIAGVVIGLVLDLVFGITMTLFGIIMLVLTWVQSLDRWMNRSYGRGIVGQASEYSLDEIGIHYENPLGSGVIPWSAVTSIRANEKIIVFARDRVVAAYVPTIAFASSVARDSFLAFARAHVPGGAAGT